MWECFCRLERNREACKNLVAIASKVLPQARRKQLQRLVKAQSITTSKQQKRACRHSDEAHQRFGQIDLPHELLTAIFDQLGPCSLGAAACVCRAWHTEALKESRWMHIYEAIQQSTVCQGCTAGRQQSYKDSVRDLLKGKSMLKHSRNLKVI